MRIDRRLMLLGVMLVVLSMTMATQYVTTKTTFTYTLVHPSEADIRFIASDNSTDGVAILRIADNASGSRTMQLRLGGNFTENYNNTYTAAFGIVNEENFSVIITHVNVSTDGGASDYLQIWLHGDRDVAAGDDGTSVMVWNKASVGFDSTDSVWGLGAGNQNASNMNTHGTAIRTPWNETAHVRYSLSDLDAVNNTDDYVWVQISVDIPLGATAATYTGTVWVHFRATTIT